MFKSASVHTGGLSFLRGLPIHQAEARSRSAREGQEASTMLRHRGLVPVVAGAVIGTVLTSTMVFRTTQAAFNGTTSSASNSWQTGGAQLSNSSSVSAAFDTATDGTLTGGQSLTRCILITYIGTSAATTGVVLYGTSSSAAGLAGVLNLQIKQGTGTLGAGAACASFSGSSLYNGSLSGFAATSTDYGSGLGSWAPAAGDTQMYQFIVTVPSTTAAQNGSASAVFTWEARAP
jgi:hypothetical protein